MVLAAWEAAARLGVINSLLLGSPTAIGSAAVAEVRSGAIWSHLGISALEFVLGIGLSASSASVSVCSLAGSDASTISSIRG